MNISKHLKSIAFAAVAAFALNVSQSDAADKVFNDRQATGR